VLGPVQLAAAHLSADTVRQPLLRVLLATLALAANRVVPASVLIDALWEEEPSRQREQNLHVQVYQLRRRLAAAEPGSSQARLVRREPGYQLMLATDELDLAEFKSLAASGRAAAAAGDQRRAATLLRSALNEWRGPALADVAELSDRLAAEASFLSQQRLAVLEDRIEADLMFGRQSGLAHSGQTLSELAAELVQLVAENPLRERLTGQLMLALYRSGQQARALQAFEAARLVLAEQLGLDPGPELRRLQELILRGDAALLRPASAGTQRESAEPADAESGSRGVATHRAITDRAATDRAATDRAATDSEQVRLVPRQLPAPLPSFAGRQDEVKELDQMLDAAAEAGGTLVITSIGGTGGIGKTTLALHWAHKIAHRFPDGQLHVNLRGFEPGGSPVEPAAALHGFLIGLGVPAGQIPPDVEGMTTLYRSTLAGRRVLVMLDNARDPAQVRPLLPASAGCLVIVTSRAAMTGLTVAEGAIPVPLNVLQRADAHALLAARLGAERTGAEPEAVADLVRLCAGLPLALAIVAARAATRPSVPLALIAAELEREQLLDALDTGDPLTSIRTIIGGSVAQLPARAARLFRLLGLHPGPEITAAACASLAAESGSVIGALLGQLTMASLLTEQLPGRYAMHDLLRAFAREQALEAEDEASRHAAVSRALDHYLHTGHAAALLLRQSDWPITLGAPEPGVAAEQLQATTEAMAWFDAEHEVLLAAVSLAIATGRDSHAWQIPWTLSNYQFMRGLHAEWLVTSLTALAAAERLGDDSALGWTHFRAGHASLESSRMATAKPGLGSVAGATDHYRAAIGYFERAATPAAEADARLALFVALQIQHRAAEAQPHADRATVLFEQAGSRRGLAITLSVISHYQTRDGEARQGLENGLQAFAISREIGDQFITAHALVNIGYAYRTLGDGRAAADAYREALDIYRPMGHLTAEADVLGQLGDTLEAMGDLDAARRAWRQALAVHGESRRLRLPSPQTGQLSCGLRRGLTAQRLAQLHSD
jgi:DNA-binding SARP family transcriptional activator